jgi:chromosomal replication initiation ATPase DnaA
LNIAKDFPGYDHSIVIYSIDIFDKLYATDADFKEKADRVYAKLGIDNTK